MTEGATRNGHDQPLRVNSQSDEKDEVDEAVLTGAQFDDLNIDKDRLTFEDDSPYPEVRSAVANTDDPDMPVATLRSWIIGLIWAMIIPGANQFFFFRFPSVTITGIVAQLLSFPLGRAAAAWVPDWTIFGIRLNPGPFTVKEHVLITVSTSSFPMILFAKNDKIMVYFFRL
ncbi:hypothetical protein H0H93_005442 [Arthromyces matolae]|nr:hypothetical protein H0H93_005442 [Arthromyces matolae]